MAPATNSGISRFDWNIWTVAYGIADALCDGHDVTGARTATSIQMYVLQHSVEYSDTYRRCYYSGPHEKGIIENP